MLGHKCFKSIRYSRELLNYGGNSGGRGSIKYEAFMTSEAVLKASWALYEIAFSSREGN